MTAYVHGKPPAGLECMVTMDDITEEEGNFCEYQTAPSMKWFPAKMSSDAVQQLVEIQFKQYMERVQQSDCQAEMKRLMAAGPPIWVADKHGLPLEEGETHVCQLWYASDSKERSAMLTGACDGEERAKLWEDLKSFQVAVEEKAAAKGADGTEAATA